MKKLLISILITIAIISFTGGVKKVAALNCMNGLCCDHDSNGVPTGHPNCFWQGEYGRKDGYVRCTWQEFLKSGLSNDQLEVLACTEYGTNDCHVFSLPDDNPSFVQGCANTRGYCKSNCTCTPRNCPTTIPPDKFRTRPVNDTGSKIVCHPGQLNCSEETPCSPNYYNSAPVCNIKPLTIDLSHDSLPKVVDLTVTDNDYGDTVQIVSSRFIKKAGDLSTCVAVHSSTGGSINNMTVKSGSDNPQDISTLTRLLVDPRESHGVYERDAAGNAVCSGSLELTIRDLDSDQAGPDISEETTCQVAVTVVNSAPTLSNVAIYDNDPLTAVQEPATRNMVDGRTALFVGSSAQTTTQTRAYDCNSAVQLDSLQCLTSDEHFIATRRNPFKIEFTVTDQNGANDIMQAGIWIQNSVENASRGATAPQYPIIAGGVRNSIQAMYSEMENIELKSANATFRFVSRACLGDKCGPQSLSGSSKQLFSALAYTPDLSSPVSANGNVKLEKSKSAPQTDWQASGFPDCLATTTGCLFPDNVPVKARELATANPDLPENYDWSIAADENHLICYASNSAVPTVISAGNPVTCPSTCAACIKKEGVNEVSGDNKSLSFAFGVYINSTDVGQGLLSGDYRIYISALDKVGSPLGNLTQRGKDGWVKFSKDGTLCVDNNGDTCARGDFRLVYDSVAPTMTFSAWSPSSTTAVDVTASLTDNAGGSGIGGVTNRFIARQEMLDGEPLGSRQWALKGDGTAFDGKSDRIPWTNSTITLKGNSLVPYESIVAGLCVYDNAGNIGCNNSSVKPPYIFLGPWIKTSYGDIFSNAGGQQSIPFNMTIPANTATNSDNTKTLAQQVYKEQEFTLVTGMFLSSGTGKSGIFGGNNGSDAFGFLANYRNDIVSTPFNVTSYTPNAMSSNVYDKIHALAFSNCDLLNEAVANTCNKNGSLLSMGTATYNIFTLTSDTTNITCKGNNLIFVTGDIKIRGNVTKATASGADNCLFVLAPSAKLTIVDTPSNLRDYPAGSSQGSPTVDLFDAGVIAGQGATFTVDVGVKGTNNSTDRLLINGFVYSEDTDPIFKRNLAPVDNRRFPSEYIVYDANALDNFRALLGATKSVDLTCGISNHVLCH